MVILGGCLRRLPNSLIVKLGHLVWMKPPEIRHQIIDYFKSQGFAEAEELPIRRMSDGLYVTRDCEDYQKAENRDGIPF